MPSKPFIEQIKAKIVDWVSLSAKVKEWKDSNKKIVFTNGCFDILHYGHIHYLAQARDLGDILIIGQNGTESVKRLKGSHRPIHDESTRQFQLAAMSFVDAVTFFEEDTPYELIKLIQPDFLVKGGDWAIDQIVGSDIVQSNGGTVKSLSFVAGYSTTAIEKKIKES